MVTHRPKVDSFTEFVEEHERRLRSALSAVFGDQGGRDAAAEALEYGWVHWDRVSEMENPVGRSRGRRLATRRRPVFEPVDPARVPEVEPKLPEALARLSQRQRLVVVLVHCEGWSQYEVADLLGLSRSAVRNHLERGMASLRKLIGGVK
jgi:DNA-directed RNA polymerase specialized sigma24 family protein